MTFTKAAKVMGITPRELIDGLGLPATTDSGQRLGRTLRKYGRSMTEARDLLSLDPAEREQ